MGRAFGYCESILGLLAAFALGISVPAVALMFGIGTVAQGDWPRGGAMIALSLLCGWSSKMVIGLASRWEREVFRVSFEPPEEPERFDFDLLDKVPEKDRRTLIGFMASSLPEIAWPFRLWCAFYWIVLVAASAWLGHGICRGAAHAANNDAAFLFLLACLGHFAFLVAANLYLVLAAAVVLPDSNEWLLFYRARILLDAAAISISIAAVFFL